MVDRNKLHSARVSFGSVECREFNRIIGEHPLVQGGIALTFGWEYVQKDQVSLEEYEGKWRQFRRQPQGGNVRRLSDIERKQILIEDFNVTLDEILRVEAKQNRCRSPVTTNISPASTPPQHEQLFIRRKHKRGGQRHRRRRRSYGDVNYASNTREFSHVSHNKPCAVQCTPYHKQPKSMINNLALHLDIQC